MGMNLTTLLFSLGTRQIRKTCMDLAVDMDTELQQAVCINDQDTNNPLAICHMRTPPISSDHLSQLPSSTCISTHYGLPLVIICRVMMIIV